MHRSLDLSISVSGRLLLRLWVLLSPSPDLSETKLVPSLLDGDESILSIILSEFGLGLCMLLTLFFNILAICRVTSFKTVLSEVFNFEEFDMLSGFRFGSFRIEIDSESDCKVSGIGSFWIGLVSGLRV